jgi:hypothetical protein
MHEMPESRCDFVLHEADAELLMPQECPEFGGGKLESGKLKIEMGAPQAEKPEMAESGSDFVLQDTDGEGLMRQKCPEIH